MVSPIFFDIMVTSGCRGFVVVFGVILTVFFVVVVFGVFLVDISKFLSGIFVGGWGEGGMG